MALTMMATSYGAPDHLAAFDLDVPEPGPGEVTIEVRAVGVNPTDYKMIQGYRGRDESKLPLPIGREVAGIITAVGAATEIGSGGGAPGDEVIAFRVDGGYAAALTVPARDTFGKPGSLGFPEAANLLLVGTTAADMLRVVAVQAGQTVLVHGASGAVGVSLLQQLAQVGARVVGTASEKNFPTVRRFGGEPVAYGDGLEDRLRSLSPDGYDGAFDCVGTDEAVTASLALAGADRMVSIVAGADDRPERFPVIGGTQPASAPYRDSMRAAIIDMAARGELVVPMSRTYPLRDAAAALTFLADGHPSGKLALIP